MITHLGEKSRDWMTCKTEGGPIKLWMEFARSMNVPYFNLYPLVLTNIAVESHHYSGKKSTISMAMFHSYVKLPEGNIGNPKQFI